MTDAKDGVPPKKVHAARAEAKETIGKLIGDDAAIADARDDKAAAKRGRRKNTNEQE